MIWGALDGLARLWWPGSRDNKAGAMQLDLYRAGRVQAGLFDAPDDPHRVTLICMTDELNRQHGAGAVRFAVADQDHAWKLRNEHLSQRYTTKWDELLMA